MKKNRKNHHAGRIISLLIVLCMVLAIAPITAFAAGEKITTINISVDKSYNVGDEPQAGVTITSSDPHCTVAYVRWREKEAGDDKAYWYSDPAKMAALSDDQKFTKFDAGKEYRCDVVLEADIGYRFDDKETIKIYENDSTWRFPSTNIFLTNSNATLTMYNVVSLKFPKEIQAVVINNAPASFTVGEAPKAMATKGDDEAYTFYEYWEEWAETEEGLEPVKFWYSDAEQMNRVPEDKRITTFEEGKTYSYSIKAEANENYTFASKDDGLSVMLNGVDFTDKSGVILDGTGLMIGPEFMTSSKPVTQKEIELIEINNATLTFKDGDKPVFTGTTPDDAPYVLDFEGWFGDDGEFICSSDYWNSAYVERGWCDGLISSFNANTEYIYQLYLKLTDEAAAQGYVFGPNTKLKVNGKDVLYPQPEETSIVLQMGTNLSMKPTTPFTGKEIQVVEINNATLTFQDGDKPIFTGTIPDDAKYRLVFEEWRTDGEWTRSDEWFNDADHHGDYKDITAFDKNKTYNYFLYLTTNAEGSEEGWYFGPNTKLKINGKEVSFARDTSDSEQHFSVTTGITMTPTAAGASDYKIIEGANGAWTQNSDGTLVFRANGDFSKFTGVKVDGTLIDAKNYTAVSGSTVITLKTDYLKTLSVGTHKLTVVYTDGECSTNFEVASNQIDTIVITDIETPVHMQEMTFSAKVPNDANYEICCYSNGYDNIFWAGSMIRLNTRFEADHAPWYIEGVGLRFLEGYYYMAIVNLKPKAGYEFAAEEDLHVTMNGEPATFVDIYSEEEGGDGTLYVYLDFGKLHTHSYSSDWKSDAANHWHECECGVKADTEAHSFKWVVDEDATATEKGSKHEECEVCGYKKAAVEIPATGTTTEPSKPADTDNPADTTKPADNTNDSEKSPQTGDNNNMMLWFAVLFVSSFGIIGTAIYGKKRRVR